MTAMQRQKLRSNLRKKFGHRNGRSSCAHSIGKFFLCYIVLFSFETSATGSPGNYLYTEFFCSIAEFPNPTRPTALPKKDHKMMVQEQKILKNVRSCNWVFLKSKLKQAVEWKVRSCFLFSVLIYMRGNVGPPGTTGEPGRKSQGKPDYKVNDIFEEIRADRFRN